LYPEKHRHHVRGDLIKILSNTFQNSQSHIFLYEINLAPELLEMNVQKSLLNTKPAMETASQLKQPSAPQALVAIPSLILAG